MYILLVINGKIQAEKIKSREYVILQSVICDITVKHKKALHCNM